MAIQTALQAPASRSDTSWAMRCRTNTSSASIAITKARNAAHAHTGTVNAGLRPAAGPGGAAGRFRVRQQPSLAEHGPGGGDGAPARDQVLVGRHQLAHGAEVAPALGAGVRHVPEGGPPTGAEGGAGRGDREEGVPGGEQP